MDPYPRGSDWMPITPKTGSLFHAVFTKYLLCYTSGHRVTQPLRSALVANLDEQTESLTPRDHSFQAKDSLYIGGDSRRVVEATEKAGDTRSPFRRDWSRLIHSASFRRLQGKT